MGVHLSFKHASRRASLRVPHALTAAALTAAALGLWVGAGASAAPSGTAPLRNGPIAVAAKTLSLNVTANLRLVSRSGRVLNHKGTMSGTLSGQIYTRGIAFSTSHGEGTFTFYPKGGSIAGKGFSRGHVVGASVYFTGTAEITGGSGTWAHASGSGLRFSGVINRQNLSITEHFAGNIRY